MEESQKDFHNFLAILKRIKMIKKVCCFRQEQLEQHIPLKDIKNIYFLMNEKEINKLEFMLTSLGRSLQGVWGPGRPVWYLRPSRSAFEGGHQRRHLSGLSEAIWVVKLKNPLCRDSHQFLAGTSIIAFISLRDVAVLISWPTFSFFFGANGEKTEKMFKQPLTRWGWTPRRDSWSVICEEK